MSTRGHLSVLLLEEHDRPRAKLAAMLAALGFGRVVQACDGLQGLAALRGARDGFGLVVCNLDLTGMDGLEFVRHASKFGVGGLILYSAHEDAVLSSAEWMARAYEVRLLGMLRSPFGRETFEPLLDKLEGHLTVYSDIVGASDPERAGRAAVDEIVAALDARCFVPHYQPKVCLKTGRLVGVKALARWEHPELGMLAPVHFVDLMEEHELIDPLTYLVLGQAAADSTTWTRLGLDVPIAINLSPLSLEEPDCAKRLLATITASGAKPSSFTFEITEKAFAKDGNAVLENVLRLRMNGCGIAVDDFGTGLLVVAAAASHADHRAEARSIVRPSPRIERQGDLDRRFDDRSRGQAAADDGRRRDRLGRAAQASRRARLRRRAGLSLRAGDGRRGAAGLGGHAGRDVDGASLPQAA